MKKILANYLLNKQWFIAIVIQRFFSDEEMNQKARDYENYSNKGTTYEQIVSEGKYHGFRKGYEYSKSKFLNAV